EVLGLGLVPIEGGVAGTPYSSTATRRLLVQGRGADAPPVLGPPPPPPQPPTVPLPARACRAADGIYAGTFVAEDGVERVGAISIGRRPTFGDGDAASLLEVHVLDFDDDLYGQAVQVRFVERLRGEERFESVDALVAQMRRDVEATRRLLGD